VIAVLLGGLSVKSVLAVSQERSKLAAQKKVNATVEADMARYASLRQLSGNLDAGRHRVQTALAGDVSWTRFLDQLVRSMPPGVWLGSLNAQLTPATGSAAAAAPAGGRPSGAGSTGATSAGGIGSLQVSATGLDYPAVAAWLRQVGADPALSGLAVANLTNTAIGTQSTVTFTSTATITPAARSDRAAKLAKAAL
jgi:Tfp pilus assembly protein PilN